MGKIAPITDDVLRAMISEERVLDCRASLGASMYPAHGNASREVLKNADVALYAAKAAGRGQSVAGGGRAV